MGYAGFGTLLKIGDGGGPENFTTIGEVGDIDGPNLETDVVETTNHSSPGGFEEVVATIKRGGEVTFPVNFMPEHATHSYSSGLIKDWNNKTKRNFQLVFPNTGNTTWQFSAFVTNFKPAAPVTDKLSADITLRITGQPTLA